MLEGFNASAATFAKDIDQAIFVSAAISIVLFFSVVGPMIYLGWKYRASNVKDENIENFTHHTGLEIAWTVIPSLLLVVFFWYGYSSMKVLRTMPDANDAITIKVEGSKWKWLYEYPANANGFVHRPGGAYVKPVMDKNGKIIEHGSMGISALYVPVGTNIILEMTAPLDDVLHSYYVPAFRMKEDVVPGRVTKQWFKADKVGEYDVECAEYCGTDHSAMFSKIVVLPKAEYEAWFNSNADTPKGSYAQEGETVLKRYGCKTCHSVTTDKLLIGPTLKTRKLTKEQVLDVINNGQNKLGYDMGPMPAGLVTGTDAQEIATYVAGGLKGTQPASFAACSSCHGEDGTGNAGTAPSLVSYDATLLHNVLKHGKKGMIGTMPQFQYVSEQEASAIAEYLNGKQ